MPVSHSFGKDALRADWTSAGISSDDICYTSQVADISLHDLRHCIGYRMTEMVPLHRLAQIMSHDSPDTTMLYVRGTKYDV